MAKFIQLIEFNTARIDEGEALVEIYRKETEGVRTSLSATLAKDRDRPNTYVNIVEFPSYEEAMKNSKLPATQKLSQELAALGEGPAVFRNLDVIKQYDEG